MNWNEIIEKIENVLNVTVLAYNPNLLCEWNEKPQFTFEISKRLAEEIITIKYEI